MKQIKKFNIGLLILALFLVPFKQDLKACVCMDPFLRIDNLDQLKVYDFIAHVKIIEDGDFKKPSKKDHSTIGLLTVKIIELFKGQEIEQVLEYSKNSSCDIGVSTGQEWILFGKTIDGKIAIYACDRNQIYRESNGLRDWKYDHGFYELRQLRKLYQHPDVRFDKGKRTEFYSNGQKEIEEFYVNGKLNGERKIWYPSGILFCHQYYINDTLDGKSEWFYPTGQIYDEDFYLKGKPCNVSRIYFDTSIEVRVKCQLMEDFIIPDDSLTIRFKSLQPQYETVFDSHGRAIISREYTTYGKIFSEEFIDPDKKFSMVIYYHENGAVSTIMYKLNGKNYGHYQEYDEKGFPDTGWDYDEKGEAIR